MFSGEGAANMAHHQPASDGSKPPVLPLHWAAGKAVTGSQFLLHPEMGRKVRQSLNPFEDDPNGISCSLIPLCSSKCCRLT